MEVFTGTYGIVLVVLAVVITILWVILPFVVIAINNILKEILTEIQMNHKGIINELRRLNSKDTDYSALMEKLKNEK